MRQWILDNQDHTIINTDHISHFYFEDRGMDYTDRYRIMAATTDSLEFIMFQGAEEEEVKNRFWDYYCRLNDVRTPESLL